MFLLSPSVLLLLFERDGIIAVTTRAGAASKDHSSHSRLAQVFIAVLTVAQLIDAILDAPTV
jgi:hypothetical protein